MLLDEIRKIVPIRYRQSVGLWTAEQSSRSKLLLYPYFLILCGSIPRNLKLLPNQECSVSYRGHNITAPRDGILPFIEVLQCKIYEKFYKLRDGDIVIDVGAYVGMFTVKAALQVGSAGRVIAIEPASSNLRYLRENTGDMANVTVVPAAASSSVSSGLLTISNASPCHTLIPKAGSITETVTTATIDSIVSGLGIAKVDFVKIDAEGSELDILKGATNTLRSNKIRIAIASYHNLPTGERELPYIDQLLTSIGFGVTIVKGYIYAEN